MNLSIRLYRMHDLDLMSLKYTKGINFSRIIKTALRSFCNQDLYIIDLEKVQKNGAPKSLPYRSFQVIKLDEEKDEKVIKLLSTVKDGYKNNFVKNIVRLYLSSSLLSFYTDETGVYPMLPTEIKELKTIGKKKVKTKKDDIPVIEKEVTKVTEEVKFAEAESVAEEKESIKEIVSKDKKESVVKLETEPEIISESNSESDSDNGEALNYFMSLM